ncbi:hypothetical protein [Halalkalibacter urbisdiaboli]|uniref:hypothetical protein n=1 Tax=Halalkalibacter urbisdiaboli TaxID=1960589 RepID=UPI0013FDB48A|nr:hypothetical protein [Halalkalibacter urbisdiaboli]
MVNQDFDKFIDVQEKHKTNYLGKSKTNKKGLNDMSGNLNTEKSVGAEGRDLPLREE